MLGLPGPTPILFFLLSVSYKLAWTAISSLLTQFSEQYGPQVLLQLNIAYFIPSVPILILQTAISERVERRLGVPQATALRFTIGLGSLAFLTSCFPKLATTQSSLLATTTAVGLAYGVAFGTSYQLASKFPPVNTVALTTGFVSSGLVVLALDLLIKRGPSYSAWGLTRLFHCVGVVTALGLLASYWLVATHWRRLAEARPRRVELPRIMMSAGGAGGAAATARKGASARGLMASGAHVRHRTEAMEQGRTYGGMDKDSHSISFSDWGEHSGALFGASDTMYGNSSTDGWEDKQAKRSVPLTSLLWQISPAALSIFLSVGTSMLVFPFFTYMHSTGALGTRLTQVLFYVRLIGDILGRLVPVRFQASTPRSLLLVALVKTVMVPLLFAAVFKPERVLGDAGVVGCVALFWVLSGYVNTCAYCLAPTLVALAERSRASGAMTVAFQSACVAALGGAAALQHFGNLAGSFTLH